MPRIGVFGQAPQAFRSLLLIEMDVDKGEAHGEHEEWCCEQKDAVAPHKCMIDAGTLELSVAKQRIGNRNQDDRSKHDARRRAQPCREQEPITDKYPVEHPQSCDHVPSATTE